ncbi:MAG: cysteine peptidase family C39 domain-containing protein, partial [Bacteroidia bacterium]
MSFPFYKQTEEMDCGPTCLRIIAKHYGKDFAISDLRNLSNTTREGSNLLGISAGAEKIGFRTLALKISFKKINKEPVLPCVAHWKQSHYVVIYKITKNKVYISDPSFGLVEYSTEDFLKCWATDNKDEGVLLLLEPTPTFFEKNQETGNKESAKYGLKFLRKYLARYRGLIVQLMLGLLIGSILQLVFPFLTQNIVDVGIRNHDVN